MNFNEEQQAHIDKLISKKYAEAMSKAEAKAAEQLSAAEAKFATDTQTLTTEIEKLRAAQGESNERVRQALLKAEIAQSSAVKVDQVMKLIGDSVVTGDDGDLKVVDDKGVVRLDEAGRPLSVKTYLEGFLHENPHLAKAAPSMGSGSFKPPFGIGEAGATSMRRRDFDALDASRKTNLIQSGVRLTD